MAAEIGTKWRPKWLKLEKKMTTGYIMAVGKVAPAHIYTIQKLAERKVFWLFTKKVLKIGKIRG